MIRRRYCSEYECVTRRVVFVPEAAERRVERRTEAASPANERFEGFANRKNEGCIHRRAYFAFRDGPESAFMLNSRAISRRELERIFGAARTN